MPFEIKDFTKNYATNNLLKGISFSVNRGEIFGIFGLTGSGKSVLMRTIAGVEKINGGKITFDEKDLTQVNGDKRGFLFPDLSNRSFWEKLFGKDDHSEIADGKGQILAFENAITEASDVLLLDNSFCRMDKVARWKAFQELKDKTREKNLTVLFATNNFTEVFQICDRVAILYDGEILQIGTPEEIYLSPNSKTVAEIFGENNLFEARRLTSKKSKVPEFLTVEGQHKLNTSLIEKEKLGAINQNMTLAIRPEHISISTGASFPEDNLLKAKITGVNFMGATTRIMLEAKELKLQTVVLRLVGLNVGDECVLGLPPDRIKVYKE
jgi:ABC-type Fe3+/spermidine/putrescine transport system ATPase subunit